MIAITSYLHREVLKNLIRRWMYNQPSTMDAYALHRLIHFNYAYVSRYLPVFSNLMFRQLHDYPVSPQPALRKGDLKDAIVRLCPQRNARIDQMLFDYQNNPGNFYRETPFHGLLYFGKGPGGPCIVGASRIKRVRRLAEKTARRIIDTAFKNILANADALARERAERMGVPLTQLITPPGEMAEEFQKAEARLLADLMSGRPTLGRENLVIQDVAGVKVLMEDARRDEFVSKLRRLENCELIEIEEHSGHYNALNLIVRYRPERSALIEKPLSERMLRLLSSDGGGEELQRQFREFVLGAEEHVHIELIVCNYQEMLESEIGRCMHEDRILKQRWAQQYTGQLARNIEFLIAYLFAFAASSCTHVNELPLKLWERYLPDYFDEVLMGLFNLPRLEIIE